MTEQPDHHSDTTNDNDDDPTTDHELDDQAGDERDLYNTDEPAAPEGRRR